MADVEANSGTQRAIYYRSKIGPQDETVRVLTDEYAKEPSDELRAKLDREVDILRYLMNSARGNPKNRARLAAEIAKRSVLNNAVVQPK